MQYLSALSYSVSFKDLHSALPLIYITSDKVVSAPSLFEICATLYLHEKSLKANRLFEEEIGVMDLSTYVRNNDPVISTILSGLLNVKVEVPFYCKQTSSRHPALLINEEEADALCDDLFKWLEKFIDRFM